LGVGDLKPLDLLVILHRASVWGNLKLETPFNFFEWIAAQHVRPFTGRAWTPIPGAGSRSGGLSTRYHASG